MPESSGRYLLTVLRRVVRQPYTISVAVLGGFGALIAHNALFLAGAVLLIAVYAAAKTRDESFIRSAIREAEDARARSDLKARVFRIEELDVESRVRMKTIVKLQSEIHSDVINSPVDEVAVGLSDTVEDTESIIDRGLAMSRKRSDLLKYLAKTDRGGIQSRIRSLQTRVDQETDETRKKELQTQISLKQQELEDYNAIESAANRVLEQLDSIEIAFSGLRARLVRIKSSDAADWVEANTELRTALSGLHTAVDSVEQSIEEALSVGGVG